MNTWEFFAENSTNRSKHLENLGVAAGFRPIAPQNIMFFDSNRTPVCPKVSLLIYHQKFIKNLKDTKNIIYGEGHQDHLLTFVHASWVLQACT